MNRKTAPPERVRFTPGSGNVFADLDLREAEDALAKARMAESIAAAIQDRRLTQEDAAGIMGVDQGTVSKVVNGRLDGFSQERLIRYLRALGADVEIVISRPEKAGSTGNLTVRTA